MKVKVISLPYIFQVLYVLLFTRPRYQVSVYRTLGPLVLFSAGEEIEEVFAEDYDDPTKDADPEPETAALAVNGDKKEKEVEEEVEEEEDNIMREVS